MHIMKRQRMYISTVVGILKGLKRLLKIYHLKGQVQCNHILPIHAFWVMRDIYGRSKTFLFE